MVPDGYVYSYELPVMSPTQIPVSDGYVYSHELINYDSAAIDSVGDGYVYSHELIKYNPSYLIPVSDGYSYSFENVSASAAPDPTALKVWDGTQWVAKPRYAWDGTAWVEIT